MNSDKVITIAFGLCFAVAMFAVSKAQQLSGGGGGVPGGSTTQVQFNNAGVFAGNSAVVINNANSILAFGGVTASFPGIKSSASALGTDRLSARLANDSDWTYLASKGIELMNGSARTGFLIQSGGNMLFSAADAAADIIFDSSTSGSGRVRFSGGQVDTNYSYQTPATGFAITLSGTIWHTVLNPAGTLATGTITMPASPIDGQIVNVRSSQVVTALTVSPNSGQSILGAPSSFAVGSVFDCIYKSSNTTWFC